MVVTAVRQARGKPCGWPPGDVRQAIEDSSDATDRAPDAATAAAVAENAHWYCDVEFADGIQLLVVGDDGHGVWALSYGEVRFLTMLTRAADGSWSAPIPLSCQPAVGPVPLLPEIVALDVSVGNLFSAGWAERRAVLVPSADGPGILLPQEGSGNAVVAPPLDVVSSMATGTSVPATVTELVALTIDAVLGGR